MTANRNLSLSVHGAIELAAGIATMVVPTALGFAPAGIIVSFVLGALLIGMALPLNAPRNDAVLWHREFDSAFLIAAAAAALALALAGQRNAGIFLAALVVIQSMLHLGTRYAPG